MVIEPHNLKLNPSVGTLRSVQPEGPYAILDYSFGGNLAVEVVRQLIADQQMVESVMVLDAHTQDSTRSRRGLKKLATHLRILARQKPSDCYAYIRLSVWNP